MSESDSLPAGFAQEVAIKLTPPILLAIPALIASAVGVVTSRWLTVAGLVVLLIDFAWGVDRMMVGEPPPDWKPADPVDTVMRERNITDGVEEFRALARSVAEQRGLTLKNAAHYVANERGASADGVIKAAWCLNPFRRNGNR